jgi:endonuclease III related protein
MTLRRGNLSAMYRALRAHFGHRHWWPGDTPFEVMVGAVLTQNTSWANVEKAISSLKRAQALSPRAIGGMPPARLAGLIRSSGYYNIKAKRLGALVSWFRARLAGRPGNARGIRTETLRAELLDINGIGPETADSILLYAFGRPVFVVDAYTRRVFHRHKWLRGDEKYDEIREMFESRLPRRVPLWNDYHAQIVAVGHHYCSRREPMCAECPLRVFPLRKGYGGAR